MVAQDRRTPTLPTRSGSTDRSRSVRSRVAVIVVVNDVLARVSAGHDVVDGTFEFEAKPTGHGRVSSDPPSATTSRVRLNTPALNRSRDFPYFPSLTPRPPSSGNPSMDRSAHQSDRAASPDRADFIDAKRLAQALCYLAARSLHQSTDPDCEAGWNLFYEACDALLRNLVRRRCDRGRGADDRVQDLWLFVIERLKSYDPDARNLLELGVHRGAECHDRSGSS